VRDMIYTAWLESAKPVPTLTRKNRVGSAAELGRGHCRNVAQHLGQYQGCQRHRRNGDYQPCQHRLAGEATHPRNDDRGELCSKAPASKGWLEPKPMRPSSKAYKGQNQSHLHGHGDPVCRLNGGQVEPQGDRYGEAHEAGDADHGMQPMANPRASVSASRRGETPCRSHMAILLSPLR